MLASSLPNKGYEDADSFLCVQDAVEAVISILGMSACDGTDAVPPNARSHTVLLSGIAPCISQDCCACVQKTSELTSARAACIKLKHNVFQNFIR